jgi:hypothetical protein
MKYQNDKTWWEYFPDLLGTYNFLPNSNNDLMSEINSTRLTIVILLILLSFDFDIKYSICVLIISNIFIILYYYQKKKSMNSVNEYYKNQSLIENFNMDSQSNINNPKTTITKPNTFCESSIVIEGPNGIINNPEWVSPSQKLAGGANPKTKIPPVMVAPTHDLDYWKSNNMVVHSSINDVSNIDVYNSGYAISSCCPQSSCEYETQQIKENFTEINDEILEPINSQQIKGNFTEINDKILEPINSQQINNNTSGMINLNCGYYPNENLKANIPVNLPVGLCQRSKYMDQINENIFTQTIQPGVYTKTEVNQPINSNIGISFTQQIPPTTEKINGDEIFYTEHDPLIYQPITNPSCVPIDEVNESNIYDPRFSGYGTSYRSYIDDTTGQPRFYYKDVDAVRMPNYVTRSHIDHLPFADTYGPIPDGNSMGNKYNSNIRTMVHDAFTNSAIEHRTDIQQSAMRKINATKWQQRLAPISTSNQRMLGSCGSNN